MSWIFLVALGLLGVLWLVFALRNMDRRLVMQSLRWIVGGVAAVIAIGALLLRRIDIAMIVGAVAASVLLRGRLGRFSFDSIGDQSSGNVSKVRSRYLAMELDHDTGELGGRVVDGQFAGWDLMDLGETETRALFEEIGQDAESVNLLESWLDTNRAGWREYFAEADAGGGAGSGAGQGASNGAAGDAVREAYAVLGLKPGASDEDIKSAHRELMKGVHPDHGGSEFLAAKINDARDLLLGR
ncbi:DnaJ domain-containing protein [Devosia sp. XJ19-1]|uniref:DnaJ domain-containing protein n=1 Tax=Devosia ureilytica TaxID=2952754 RepID=A0A9Q4FRP0_9HYPH|nr:DnaJ domain-containing protein [Devosia ureilytica]MCP8882100.1 DnaJ domain-containing protein [Devosia ureilytica]MCP8886014.1 DnaJ domain-containing protein [Devosia ureilytica]